MKQARRFLDLTPGECMALYPEVMKNAVEFYETGEILGKAGYYGKAITHLILGAEEYIKCLFLFLDGHQFELRKIKEVEGIFRYHLPRHNILRDSYSVWIVFKHVFAIKSTQSKRKIFQHLLQAALSVIPAMSNHDWWKQADWLKQKGLYVDFQDGPVLPDQLSISDYEETVRRTKSIPAEIQGFIRQINKMSPRQLTELRRNFKEADFPLLIAESINRKHS